MTKKGDRLEAARRVWSEYEWPLHEDGGRDHFLESADRFALVEKGRDGYFLTRHASPEAAGEYTSNQECADDWHAVRLIDLDTGDQFEPVLTFRRADVGVVA